MNKPYSAEIFFSQTDVICVAKTQQKYFQSVEMCFYGFSQNVL